MWCASASSVILILPCRLLHPSQPHAQVVALGLVSQPIKGSSVGMQRSGGAPPLRISNGQALMFQHAFTSIFCRRYVNPVAWMAAAVASNQLAGDETGEAACNWAAVHVVAHAFRGTSQ